MSKEIAIGKPIYTPLPTDISAFDCMSELGTLVFAGGIGKNAAAVRARMCDGLEYRSAYVARGIAS